MERPSALAEGVGLVVQFPLCTISIPIEDLSAHLGIPVARWEEPGLGNASGFGCLLASGSVVFLEELVDVRQRLGVNTNVYVEAAELAEQGVDAAVVNTLAGLGLPPWCVTWVQTAAGVQSAGQVAKAAEERARKQNGS